MIHTDPLMDRYRQIPTEIVKCSGYNPLIHAAIRTWLPSDNSVESLLIHLILLLDGHTTTQTEQIKELIAKRA